MGIDYSKIKNTPKEYIGKWVTLHPFSTGTAYSGKVAGITADDFIVLLPYVKRDNATPNKVQFKIIENGQGISIPSSRENIFFHNTRKSLVNFCEEQNILIKKENSKKQGKPNQDQ